jgi:sterol desaturase/sphingolipid hydroxylase (fatty acid hydroxylase superfamily)
MTIQIIPFAAAVLLIILERRRNLSFRPAPLFRRSFLTDVFYLLTGYVGLGWLGTACFADGSGLIGEALLLPRPALLELPFWLLFILALVALDAGNYLAHYLMHKYDFLWEFHKVHHSSPQLDWLATFRSHLFEQILRRVLAPLLLIPAGFPPEVVLSAGGVYIAWAIFNHSNLGVGLNFLEPILITPRLHRTHHLDDSTATNLGTIFSFWDRLGGTLNLTEKPEDISFGNGEANYPHEWHRQLVAPLRRLLKG